MVANASPLNEARDPSLKEVRDIVGDTCAQLLVKLETVRLSVLHLQYSMHTGDLADDAAAATARSDSLWEWAKGGDFSAELAHGGRLQGVLDDVFDGGCTASTSVADSCAGGGGAGAGAADAGVGVFGGGSGGACGAWDGRRGAGGPDGEPDGKQQLQRHDGVDAAGVDADVPDGVNDGGVRSHGHAAGSPRMLAAAACLPTDAETGGSLTSRSRSRSRSRSVRECVSLGEHAESVLEHVLAGDGAAAGPYDV